MVGSNPRDTPMSAGADTSARRADEPPLPDPNQYRGAVGALLYLACTCRPDISFAVSVLAKANHDPAMRHWRLVQGVLRYLQGTRDLGLVYRSGTPTLIGYTDADYAGDTLTRKSRSGFVFLFAGAAISWHSRQQPIVATSTAESEYTAAFTAAQEAAWLRQLFFELHQPAVHGPVTVLVDNQAAIAMATSQSDSARTKHIDVRCHYLRDLVLRQVIQLRYVRSELNAADMFTKPLDRNAFFKLRSLIGMG